MISAVSDLEIFERSVNKNWQQLNYELVASNYLECFERV